MCPLCYCFEIIVCIAVRSFIMDETQKEPSPPRELYACELSKILGTDNIKVGNFMTTLYCWKHETTNAAVLYQWIIDTSILNRCDLLTPYGDAYLGKHWLRQWLVAWRHQPLPATNQCRVAISELLWQSHDGNITYIEYGWKFENYEFNITAASSRSQWCSRCWLDLHFCWK